MLTSESINVRPFLIFLWIYIKSRKNNLRSAFNFKKFSQNQTHIMIGSGIRQRISPAPGQNGIQRRQDNGVLFSRPTSRPPNFDRPIHTLHTLTHMDACPLQLLPFFCLFREFTSIHYWIVIILRLVQQIRRRTNFYFVKAEKRPFFLYCMLSRRMGLPLLYGCVVIIGMATWHVYSK